MSDDTKVEANVTFNAENQTFSLFFSDATLCEQDIAKFHAFTETMGNGREQAVLFSEVDLLGVVDDLISGNDRDELAALKAHLEKVLKHINATE